MSKTKVLYISQEIMPFLPESEISKSARFLPQAMHEKGREIRVFMPRYGKINERRHQLHEVIRLSGMNMIINDTDHPLIIKVASIPTARMQVYFIDNEEYFKRKFVLTDDKDKYFKDSDERGMFFIRGVIETVKKLGWTPDIIHCHGWMSALAPIYLKKIYHDDPHFANAKIVTSLYKDGFDGTFDKKFIKKLEMEGLNSDEFKFLSNPNFDSLNQMAINFSDGIIKASEELTKDTNAAVDSCDLPVLDFVNEEESANAISAFYDSILEKDTVLVEE